MRCLVFVKFMPEGSLPAEVFFTHLNASWTWLGKANETINSRGGTTNQTPSAALCITNCESIKQLTLDLVTMPGAGIDKVEVVPLGEEQESA